MRTIKFRGYNRKNNEWLHGFYLQNRGAHFVCPDEFATNKCFDDYQVDPETVGQFTGIVDKNDKEIYEGDIVKTQFSKDPLGHVVWHNNGYFCICTSDERMKYGEDFTTIGQFVQDQIDGDRIKIDVIGNIHDNPELISK